MFLPIILVILAEAGARYEQSATANANANATAKGNLVKIGKCCEQNELMVDNRCDSIGESNETSAWKPEFEEHDGKGKGKHEPRYELRIGTPKCERQATIYHYPELFDRLTVLPSGELRHDVLMHTKGANNEDDEEAQQPTMYNVFQFGEYCIDKVYLSRDKMTKTYAIVCDRMIVTDWTTTDYLMRRVIDPTIHAIAIICYLVVAVVYFVLPQLRDLVGNMITSMTLCLIASQCADLVRIFTEFSSHVSFLAASMVTYISLLSAFLWLNSLGYYIWKTFRSRNVFLRVTDGRKYCYYSSYVWGLTVSIAAMSIFAHFVLDTDKPTIIDDPVTHRTFDIEQETIGWLGISVLFTTVAFTVIIDLCFVLTTMNTIKRMNTYGRIHHKMKYSFRMFILLFIVMSVTWLFQLLSWLRYDIIEYCYIAMNLLQAISILYICVFSQRRVTFLLKKTCNCCNPGDTPEGLDWGEEMMAMNAGY